MFLFPTLKGYKKEYLVKDILSGIVIAAVSIPISMGYAEVAGIPAVYGLYGSVLPILFFALFTSSPQFIFGVDAAPAAIVGAALLSAGIEPYSGEALIYVPALAFFTGLWLLLFYCLKAGRLVDYISSPVMGGFISGIAVTIILMQLPKILGSPSGSGELFELCEHIISALKNINLLSVLLGAASLIIILISNKLIPKFPMAIVIMALGVILTSVFHVDEYGVKLLSQVEPGLPGLAIPEFSKINVVQAAGRSFIVAIVVMAETLLSENNFALKNGYKIDDNKEVLACGAGNIAAALVGCLPVNGSISRTSMNDQYGGKTQAVSITAAILMVFVLLFATPFIGLLPVPVLTAIVTTALLKVVEFDLAKRLFKVSRTEFYIFMAAFFGVLILGTIYGVIIGIVLSFVAVIIRETNPPRTFLGKVPGKDGFYDLTRDSHAHEIEGVKIYQFSESLFFANIKIFKEDVEKCIDGETKAVIVDMSTVTGIDITAADRLMLLSESLERQGVGFYLTEHAANVNGQLRALGKGRLIEKGHVRRTITSALHDIGLEEPYPLKGLGEYDNSRAEGILAEEENTLEEFAWAFGDEAVSQIEKLTHAIIGQLEEVGQLEELAEEGLEGRLKYWKWLGAIDEDELVRRIELHMDELPPELLTERNKTIIWKLLEKRRRRIREQLLAEAPEELARLDERRAKLETRLGRQNPEAAKRLKEWEEYQNH